MDDPFKPQKIEQDPFKPTKDEIIPKANVSVKPLRNIPKPIEEVSNKYEEDSGEEEPVKKQKPKIVSMEVALEAQRKKLKIMGVDRSDTDDNDSRGATVGDAINNIVNHLINASELKLLQLTHIPRNVIFDIMYDITQRAILDQDRIRLKVPLSKIALEVYLRATRGADNMLAVSMYDLAGQQINAESGVSPLEDHQV